MRTLTLTALIVLFALPAGAEPETRARADTERSYFVEAGWAWSAQGDPTRWLSAREVDGVGVTLGLRHDDWLNVEARFDFMTGDDAWTHGGQLAGVFDPGWTVSPTIGAWVGYRNLEYDWAYRQSSFCVLPCNADAVYPEHRGTTLRTAVMAGLELGLRLRLGPMTASTALQAGAPMLRRDQTTWHTTATEHRPDLDAYGPELNFGVKVGAAF